MAPKAIHFGAGNIGRGFVAEKLYLSGFEVVFLDVVSSLIDALQTNTSYTVTEIGAEGTKVNTIKNYRAINSKTHEEDAIKEIATADVVTCAVGPNILKFIAPVIAKGINTRSPSAAPLAVIACENMIGGTDKLAEFIRDIKNTPTDRVDSISDRARFANSAIDRIVPAQDPDAGLNVTIESFFEWVVDQTPFESAGGHPKINSVHWVTDLRPFIERKLFTVNTSHATAAYYGYNRGIKTVDQAVADPEINKQIRAVLAETAHLIVTKHGIDKAEQDGYVEKIINRIANPHLKDGVERVGRAPLRKLGRNERFVGPAAELAAGGSSVDALLGSIEMAFRFQNVDGDDESKELATILANTSSPEEIVTKVCGLTSADKLFAQVVEVVKKVKA